jgi:hypothetical protein
MAKMSLAEGDNVIKNSRRIEPMSRSAHPFPMAIEPRAVDPVCRWLRPNGSVATW